MRTMVLCFILLTLAGCQHYWYKPNGTLRQFATDHRECLEKGDPVPDQPGSVILDEGVFRRCMAVRGWRREEHQTANVPAGRFRGVEDFELRPVPVEALPEQPRSVLKDPQDVVLTGAFQNTPAQERTWNAYHACTGETGANAVMQRVDPDGRYYVRCSDHCTRWAEFTGCMREKTRAQRGNP